MKIMKIIGTLSAVVLSAQTLNAAKMETFGCGITKNAFLKALNSEFAKKTNMKVKVNAKGGAGRAIKEVGKGSVNIGSGCRPTLGLKGEDNTVSHHVGWGALVFIVNPKNKVTNITSAQAKDVLTGKITNWKEIGGDDAGINLYLRRGKVSGVGYSTRMIMFNDKETSFLKTAKRLKSSGPIRAAISKDPNAFAIDDISSSKKKKSVKSLTLDGVEASKENISSGKYGLYRPLYIYAPKVLEGHSKEFFDFAFSDEGQATISKAGTVNLEEGKNLKAIY